MNGCLLIGDWHLCDKPPSGATDAYLDEQWAVGAEALQIAADANLIPVFAGDIFHSKISTRNSYGLTRKLIELCKESPIQPFVVVGNHDIQHDLLSTLSSQPLGVVLAAGAMRELVGQSTEYPFLIGSPWGSEIPVARQDQLVVAHADIYPDGQVPPWGGTAASDWAHAQQRGFCYYGHIHDRHGIYQAGSVTFANVGALTRGALTESERTRKPAVTAWGLNGIGTYEFREIELKSPLPAEEVLRIVELEEVRQQRADAEDFLAQLQVSPHSSLAEAIDEIRKLEDVEEHVKALAIDLIDKVTV